MQVQDLVRETETGHMGVVLRVDKDYFGARTAFKVVGWRRGDAISPDMVNTIGPTKDGVSDRIKVAWTGKMYVYEYIPSFRLEVISASR